MESNEDDLTSSGSLFHDECPATVKSRSAKSMRYLRIPPVIGKYQIDDQVFVRPELSDEWVSDNMEWRKNHVN